MTTTNKQKFVDLSKWNYPITFNAVGDVGGCCGTIVINNLGQPDRAPSVYDWNYGYRDGKKRRQLKTREAVFTKFHKDVLKDAKSYFDKYGVPGSYLWHIVLITKYPSKVCPDNQGQIPGLCENMQENGWEVVKVWTNSNTGNELTELVREFKAEEFGVKFNKTKKDYDALAMDNWNEQEGTYY